MQQLKAPCPALACVNSERLWIKYKSDHGITAICTVYLGFQADDNRHQDWNEGIYKVLADEIWDLRVNAAVRTQGNWDSRICKGLWIRHASNYVSSSILDYVVVSSEHLGTIVEMVVDQGGLHGGTSDHNMLFTRVVDKFKAVPELPPVRNAGWDTEKADWPKFREVVQGEVGHLISGTTKASGVDSMSDVLSRALTHCLSGVPRLKKKGPGPNPMFLFGFLFPISENVDV